MREGARQRRYLALAAAAFLLVALLSPVPAAVAAVIPFHVVTTSLPPGTVSVPYHALLTAQGGPMPYNWSGSGLPSGLSLDGGGTISGIPQESGDFQVTVSVTDAPVGGSVQGAKATLPLSITPFESTTTTTTTTVPRTTTTTRPVSASTTTTTHPAVTTTLTTVTTVAPTTVVPTTVAPTIPTVPPTTTSVPPTLVLSQPSVPPGGQISVSGNGCAPGSGVSLTIGTTTVGTSAADNSGSFSASIQVPDLPLGRVDVVVGCGATFVIPLEIAVATNATPSNGTLGLFFFFFLLVLMIFRRRRLVRPRRIRRADGDGDA